MRKLIGFLGMAVIMAVAAVGEGASWDWVKEKVQTASSTQLSDTTVGKGLKEALSVGIKNAIALLGQQNGFYANEAVKVLMPEQVRKAQPLLEKAGFGPMIDEFVLSMNRAAEKATPLAADIFAGAVTGMSFDDVQRIRNGGDTAATDYFREKTSAELLAAFKPAIDNAMRDYAVTEKYAAVMDRVRTLPLMNRIPTVDIDTYVASKTLDGLFLTLGTEEAKIRNNPSARVTGLLQEVFK